MLTAITLAQLLFRNSAAYLRPGTNRHIEGDAWVNSISEFAASAVAPSA